MRLSTLPFPHEPSGSLSQKPTHLHRGHPKTFSNHAHVPASCENVVFPLERLKTPIRSLVLVGVVVRRRLQLYFPLVPCLSGGPSFAPKGFAPGGLGCTVSQRCDPPSKDARKNVVRITGSHLVSHVIVLHHQVATTKSKAEAPTNNKADSRKSVLWLVYVPSCSPRN